MDGAKVVMKMPVTANQERLYNHDTPMLSLNNPDYKNIKRDLNQLFRFYNFEIF